MRKKDLDVARRSSALVLVDESNVGSSVRDAGRGLDWLRLREFLAGADRERDLIEMVVICQTCVQPPAVTKTNTKSRKADSADLVEAMRKTKATLDKKS